jgi:hypothetical protein
MKLKSFGCSFIFGNDLHDDGRDGPWGTPSQHTWPALAAQRLGMPYQCWAKGGIGNLQILDRVLLQAAYEHTYQEQSFFVINWTWVDRFDYITDHDAKVEHTRAKFRDTWSTITPAHDSEEAQFYYRRLHSQHRDKLTSLIYIRTAIETLEQKGIPFLMTYMDDIIKDTQHDVPYSILDCQDRVFPHLHAFEGENFLDWSRTKKYPISPLLHPLEEAHAAGADIMTPIIDAIRHRA